MLMVVLLCMSNFIRKPNYVNSKGVEQATDPCCSLPKWYKCYTFMLRPTVNVLKIQTLDACQKGMDKQCRTRSDCFFRSSLIRVFHVCYFDEHFVNYSPGHYKASLKLRKTKFKY